MINEPKPVKLFSYVWIYLGAWIVATIGASVLSMSFVANLQNIIGTLAVKTCIIIALLMFAGYIMTQQFYKHYHRAFTIPELKYIGRRIALIITTANTLIGITTSIFRSISWWTVIIVLATDILANWGLVVLSLNLGNKIILKRVKTNKNALIE